MQHKFAVGQMVDLISARGSSNRPAGLCRVVMQLPFEGRRLQYRVQSMNESTQRVVDEDDLRVSDAKAEKTVKAEEEQRTLFSSIAITRR